MKVALKDKPPTPFRVPPGIKLIRDRPPHRRARASGEGDAILEAFKPGTAPPTTYSIIGSGGRRRAARVPDAGPSRGHRRALLERRRGSMRWPRRPRPGADAWRRSTLATARLARGDGGIPVGAVMAPGTRRDGRAALSSGGGAQRRRSADAALLRKLGLRLRCADRLRDCRGAGADSLAMSAPTQRSSLDGPPRRLDNARLSGD